MLWEKAEKDSDTNFFNPPVSNFHKQSLLSKSVVSTYRVMSRNKIIPYRRDLKVKARRLRNESTYSEILLWQEIKNKQLGYQFHRQVPLLDYIVDFYCHELHLAIEVDGNCHESDLAKGMMLNDNPDWRNAESDFYALMTIG